MKLEAKTRLQADIEDKLAVSAMTTLLKLFQQALSEKMKQVKFLGRDIARADRSFLMAREYTVDSNWDYMKDCGLLSDLRKKGFKIAMLGAPAGYRFASFSKLYSEGLISEKSGPAKFSGTISEADNGLVVSMCIQENT